MSGPQHQLGWRLLGEFSVIVLGVLVALGVDSWVERRADQATEREALEGLRADLVLNIEDLSQVSAGVSVQVARLEWLRGFPVDGSVSFPLDSLEAITSAANVTGSYAPVLRTYERLISTGDLRLVRSTEIQLGLAELQKGFEVYGSFRDQATNAWLLAYKPEWHKWIGVDHDRRFLAAPPVLEALQDRSFRSLLRSREIFLSILADSGRSLTHDMQALVNLIDNELAAQ